MIFKFPLGQATHSPTQRKEKDIAHTPHTRDIDLSGITLLKSCYIEVELAKTPSLLCQVMINQFQKVIDCAYSGVVLLNQESKAFELAHWNSSDARTILEMELDEQIETGVFSQVIHGDELIFVNSQSSPNHPRKVAMLPLGTSSYRAGVFIGILKNKAIEVSPTAQLLLLMMGRYVSFALQNLFVLEEFERKKESEVGKFKSYAEDIIRSLTDALIIFDQHGTITRTNEPTQNLLGYSAHQLEGLRFKDIVKNHEKGDAIFKEVLEKGTVIDLELSYYSHDGSEQLVSFSASTMKDGENNVIGVVSISRDITARKETELSLLAKNKELETFHRVAINRELKMIELKKKISELEEKLVRAGSNNLNIEAVDNS